MAGRDDDSTTAIDADDNTRANGRTSGKPSQFILLLERELGVPVLPTRGASSSSRMWGEMRRTWNGQLTRARDADGDMV
jgi:hypothetical protein